MLNATELRTALKPARGKQLSELQSHTEHHPLRARMLRQAIARSGKNIAQHTATELIAINNQITAQIEATHEAA